MTLETFFEKFDHFADAPGAVPKMRELILQLAAHGRLVEQSADDGPASALLSQIEQNFRLLRAARKVRGEPVESLTTEKLPGIPANWTWVPLGNVADYGSSDKVESSSISEDAWLLDLEDIEKDTSRLLRRKTYRDDPSRSTKTVFIAGDVLYGKLRPYLNKVLVADAPGYCTTEIIPIRTFGFIEPMYLCYALKRPEFVAYANTRSYGMNLPRLGTEDARMAPFPLPPLAEQKRIVAKVNELMALCDRLEEQQQEREKRQAVLSRAALARFADQPIGTNLNFLFHNSYAVEPADLRKAIISLAIQGRLVRQDPNDADSAALLVEIEVERRRYAEAQRFRAPSEEPIPAESVPFSLPASWTWCYLSSICNAVTDGDHLPPPKSDDGIAFLTIGNITTGVLNFEGCRFVPQSYFERVAAFRRPTRGDILYTVVGATFGRPALVDTDRPFCVQRHIAILKPSKHIEVRFVMAVLRSALAYEQATASTTGTAQPTIPLGSLRSFMVPLPPIAEQRRIVEKVDQLMVLVDKLEADADAFRIAGAELVRAAVAELTAHE